MFPRITEARHVREYVLELTFAGGERGEVDCRDMIVGREGLLAELEALDTFSRVRVDREAGTIVWPNGVDFCPVVLHSKATGTPIPEPDTQVSQG